MSERHPDIFTREEAAAYLHLDNAATIDWLREQNYLTGEKIGKDVMFDREALDLCRYRMFKRPAQAEKTNRRQALKLAQG